MLNEFRDFITKGNVMDLAVAVIIGAAFGSIVTSLVNDIIMPILSLFTGGIDFTNLFVPLDGSNYATLAAAQEAGASVFAYGSFIQAIINFLILAFVIFLLVRQVNKMMPKEEAAPAGPSAEDLLTEIRDTLRSQR